MSSKRQRLDVVLVQRGLSPTRRRAQGAIMAGTVFVDGRRVDKPGTPVAPDAPIEVRGSSSSYVSRGGKKLAEALKRFSFDVTGVVAADIGASTGGFTDCLLQNGAARVYAVDVGYGQLDWQLRNDPRVIVMERTNARHMRAADLPEAVDLVVMDVSFISVTKIFEAVTALLKPEGHLICLVKPQFEAGPAQVGRGGVVRDAAVHRRVLQTVIGSLARFSLVPLDLAFSPITGPKGNIEYLLFARHDDVDKGTDFETPWKQRVAEVVAAAHRTHREAAGPDN